MPANREDYVERQRVLADFGELALRCEDLQLILDEGCKLVGRALKTDLAKMLELAADGQSATIRAGFGWNPGTMGRQVDLGDRSSEAFSLRKGRPVITQNIATEDRFDFPEFLREHGVVAIVNAPIFLPGGRPYGLLQVDSREPRDFGDEDLEFLRSYCAVLGPVIDRLFKIADLDRANERFRVIVENAHGFGILLSDPEDIITDWFPSAVEVFGWSAEEAVGKPVSMIFTSEDREAGVPRREVERAMRDGKAPNIRWHATKSGRRVFVDGQTIVLRKADETVMGFLKIGQDLTERKRNEERQTVLLAELQHRVRNVLAMVSSVVRRGDLSASTQEFRDRLSGRISAMARTQALLTRGAGVGIGLEDLVHDELLVHADEDRLTIEGPQIMLAPKAAEVLTLAVHELATNATKYGALAQQDGAVEVHWRIEPRADQDWLILDWRERATEPVEQGGRHEGFGTELITRRVPYELRGEGEMTFEPEGLRCRIAFPLSDGESILQTSAPPLPKTERDEL